MRVAKPYIWLPLIICLFHINLVGQIATNANQGNLLSKIIYFTLNENTLRGHIDNLLVQENISLSFNSSRVELDEVIILPKGGLRLEDFITTLFHNQTLKLTAAKNKILITFLDKKRDEFFTIRGYIRDKQSGEILVGATIEDVTRYSSTFTSDNGFFSLKIPIDSNKVRISYLGYESQVLTNIKNSRQDIALDFDNLMPQIIIKESVSDNFLLGSGSERVDMALTKNFKSISGDNDPVKTVRINPGVQSGNEGQTGLYVRGGSNDQNLILFEGIPLYEVSHTAGLSSMFIEEGIHNIDFIKNGFPARYGGRLSSVLNVQLKDGNTQGFHGGVTASLPAIKANIEGPIISDETTINLSGRMSYLDTYFNELAGDRLNFDVDLDYHDFVAKVTHRFTSDRKVSFSYYSGGDDLGLQRERAQNIEGDVFRTKSKNSLNWGSTLWNFNSTNILNEKLQLSFNVGGLDYQYTARSTFNTESISDGLKSEELLDVFSLSSISDYLANVSFDYYANDQHRLKFGAGWIYHQYNPAVRSNKLIRDNVIDSLVSNDQIIVADELSAFIEDTYDPSEKWQLYGGLHISGFRVGEVSYNNLEPRLSIVFKPNKLNRFTFSYTKMNQYVHLLVNPGIGLPSNLWVPSTERIKPESADQVSLSYSSKLGRSWNLSISGYYKYMQNLVEFTSPTDLIVIGGIDEIPTIQENPEWRDKVELGTSDSRGFEVQLLKSNGALTGWVSYAHGKTDRLFPNLNEGLPFPYKYDRRNDVNIGVQYEYNPNWTFSANWIYGTGNTFSLAIESFEGPSNPTDARFRNNERFIPYHHLDVQINYQKYIGSKGKLDISLGLVNVYDRRNVYYLYIYENPLKAEYDIRKTTLFPILPNLSIGYSI